MTPLTDPVRIKGAFRLLSDSSGRSCPNHTRIPTLTRLLWTFLSVSHPLSDSQAATLDVPVRITGAFRLSHDSPGRSCPIHTRIRTLKRPPWTILSVSRALSDSHTTPLDDPVRITRAFGLLSDSSGRSCPIHTRIRTLKRPPWTILSVSRALLDSHTTPLDDPVRITRAFGLLSDSSGRSCPYHKSIRTLKRFLWTILSVSRALSDSHTTPLDDPVRITRVFGF